ncbi:Divergent AAA domain [Moraxella lacunata]|uniref:Divergent AAA domain n=1 Tax=Moraxella lacunata TaxID=477 RepID=A0A378TR23_MORLA|nr:RNA-binding domain-containing protein [Moraxella lacunata]STZ63177.1 Divergent AAA domain [Moraxella lacunata]
MNDIANKLIELLTQIESEVIEFKEAQNSFDDDKLGKYFSALSNEANLRGLDCAWLIFGVKDNHKVIGSRYKNTEKELLAVKKMIADNTNNNISFKEIYTLNYQGKRIVLFEIPPALKGIPTTWKGHYYARQGESLTSLDLHKIEQIRNQQNMSDWSAGIVENASIDDLSMEAIAFARIKYAEKHPDLKQEIEGWDNITFLNKAKLTIKGKITRTAIILLGLPESEVLINPATPTMTWILKDRDGIEKDYQHFGSPLLLNVDKLASKIRNLKYRYIKQGTLFPEEIDQYDGFVIREALHNAIAHQDYQLGGKISIVEFESGRIVFKNKGRFIPNDVWQVISSDAPEERYRNRFLANAMVNLKMIDTIGSGIKKMFLVQKERYFPLPDYDLSNDSVQVSIEGKILDINYAQKLASLPDLSLYDIFLLDRVQKKLPISDEQAKNLKKLGLIEGRKPNYCISADVAEVSDEQVHYMHHTAFDDQYYKDLIIKYLQTFTEAGAQKFRELLYQKFPDGLSEEQKHHKVKNLLQALKRAGKIYNINKVWRLSDE